MPTVGIKKLVLNKHFRQDYSQEECEKIFFDYGLELDEVTSEKESVEKERGAVANLAELSDQEVYKIEVPANRYDLLSVEGLTRALRIFRNEISAPRYEISTPKELQKIIVGQETSLVRPFVVGAVLRGITFDADSYASFIDLQDKLHQNICRKRSLVAIGTHDLDTIKGPFEYRAEKPSAIRFKPLNQTREFTAEELMTLYSTDSHLKAYLPIIADKELYPVIYDSNNVVCSMPPIINGDHSKITLKTKNVFIEATATDHTKAVVVLDTIVALFSEYCDQKYTVEPVLVEYYDDRRWQYPKLEYRTKKVRVKEINTKIGFELPAKEIATLLDRMSLEAKVIDDETLTVVVPPTRHDILHECDIAEDVGVAHGFNNLKQKLPEAHTVATAFPLNELSEQLRFGMAAAGWTETLNFALCARDDIASKLRHPEALAQAVHIGNPKTQEFQVARTSLIPGLLKTISSNSHLPLPLKLFELQDVVLKNPDSDVGASNQRRLAALFYNKTAGFEIVHGLLDRIMRLLDVNPSSKTNENGYKIQAADDAMFFPDRCAKVLGPGDQVVGTLGVLHPEVILAFGLTLPCAALEINVEPF